MKSKRPQLLALLLLLLALLIMPSGAYAQPAPLDTLWIPLAGGTLTLPCYTPLAMSYYPYFAGQPNDTIRYVLGDQLVAGTATTADRIIDVTAGGTYAYRDPVGVWTGSLQRIMNARAYLVLNRHDARSLVLVGLPRDTITYLMPMPNGSVRYTAPRMLCDHPISGVGLSTSGFHWSANMRRGGDIIIDLTTRQIARRDSTDGWIGTMTQLQLGHPVLIQVNYPYTFDWTYNPNRE